MRRFPPTATLPLSRTELQLVASILPPIVDGSVYADTMSVALRPTRTFPLILTKERVQYLPFGTVTLPSIFVTADWPPMRPKHVISFAAASGGATRNCMAADRTNASAEKGRVVIGVLPSFSVLRADSGVDRLGRATEWAQ